MCAAHNRATSDVFAFTPKILVQLDAFYPFIFFFPSTASLLKFACCCNQLLWVHSFQFPVQRLVARLVAEKDKCWSINYRQIIQYTHHYCNLKSLYSVLYLCTRAAAVQIFTGTSLFSAMTFFNPSHRWPPSHENIFLHLLKLSDKHDCENSTKKCVQL